VFVKLVMTTCVFVSNQNSLSTAGGGVQWCTRDYLDTIAAAGIEVQTVAYDTDQRPGSRLRRKFAPRPFENLVPAGVVSEIEAARKASASKWIFLNNSEHAPFIDTP